MTRLETRTKECSIGASLRVEKLQGEMKVTRSDGSNTSTIDQPG
jgi:hypothetical protein